MKVHTGDNAVAKKVKELAVISDLIQVKRSELKRYRLYLGKQNYKDNIGFMKVRFRDDTHDDMLIWLGFNKDSEIFSIFRVDSGLALSYIKDYFKTLLDTYKDRELRIININIASKTDIDVLYKDIKTLCDNITALFDSERIFWDFCPSVIIWEVMSDDFYKDRATQFFMLGNYANNDAQWHIFDRPDAWTLSYYDSRFNKTSHDYTFAGQRFRISKGILYFKENIPVRKHNYKIEYHTELFAVKLIDFCFLGKIKEYAVIDKNAPYIPEEYCMS